MGLFGRRKKQQQQNGSNGSGGNRSMMMTNGYSGQSQNGPGTFGAQQSEIVTSQRSMHASPFESLLIEVSVACFPTEARIASISRLYNELEIRRQPYHDIELIYHNAASILYQKLSVCLSTNPSTDELSLIMATLDVLHISSEEALEQVFDDIGRETLPLLVKVLFIPFTSSIQTATHEGYTSTAYHHKQQQQRNARNNTLSNGTTGHRELERSGRRASPPIKMAVEHACKILAAYSLLPGSAVYDLCLTEDLLWGLTCIMDKYQGQNDNARYAALAALTNISGGSKQVPEIALKLKRTPGVLNGILKMCSPEESITAQRHANQARANLGLSVHVHQQQPHYYTSSSGTDDCSSSGIHTYGASTFGQPSIQGAGTTSGGSNTGQSSSGVTTEGGIYSYSGTSTSGASTGTDGAASDGAIYGGGRAAARISAASSSGGTSTGGTSSGRSLSGYDSSTTEGERSSSSASGYGGGGGGGGGPFGGGGGRFDRTALETVNEQGVGSDNHSAISGRSASLFGAAGRNRRFQTIEQQEQQQQQAANTDSNKIERSSMRWRGGGSVRLQKQQQQQPAPMIPNTPTRSFRQSASVHRFGSSRVSTTRSIGTIGTGDKSSVGDNGSVISASVDSYGDNSAIDELRNSSSHVGRGETPPTNSTRKLGLGYRGGGGAPSPGAATGGVDESSNTNNTTRLSFSQRYGHHSLKSSASVGSMSGYGDNDHHPSKGSAAATTTEEVAVSDLLNYNGTVGGSHRNELIKSPMQ